MINVCLNFDLNEDANTIEELFGVNVVEDRIIDDLKHIINDTETPMEGIIEIFKREKGAKAIILYQMLIQLMR